MAREAIVATLMEKAERALQGARVMLDIGNAEGACNRAYYAMHDAARAALIAAGTENPDRPIKTHRGLIAEFGKLVRRDNLDPNLGRAFNKAEDIRLFADYSGEIPPLEEARWAVDQAETFVAAIQGWLAS